MGIILFCTQMKTGAIVQYSEIGFRRRSMEFLPARPEYPVSLQMFLPKRENPAPEALRNGVMGP